MHAAWYVDWLSLKGETDTPMYAKSRPLPPTNHLHLSSPMCQQWHYHSLTPADGEKYMCSDHLGRFRVGCVLVSPLMTRRLIHLVFIACKPLYCKHGSRMCEHPREPLLMKWPQNWTRQGDITQIGFCCNLAPMCSWICGGYFHFLHCVQHQYLLDKIHALIPRKGIIK